MLRFIKGAMCLQPPPLADPSPCAKAGSRAVALSGAPGQTGDVALVSLENYDGLQITGFRVYGTWRSLREYLGTCELWVTDTPWTPVPEAPHDVGVEPWRCVQDLL